MSKTIYYTKKRRCCEPQDFVPIVSKISKEHIFKCTHCGDWWYEKLGTDAAGSRSSNLVRWFPSIYKYDEIKKICHYGD